MNSKISLKKSGGIISLILAVLLLNLCTEEPFEPEVTGSIKGEVRNATTNQPVFNVTIQTKPATEVVQTDSLGYYEITGIDTGRYNVVAEKSNYESKIQGILVKENHTSTVDFLLKKTSDSEGLTGGEIKFTNNFSPADGSEDESIDITLSWQAKTEENGDSLQYDVLLYTSNTVNETLIAENLKDTFIRARYLNYNEVYFWQVIAKNSAGDTSHSKIHSFATRGVSENSFFFVKKINGSYEVMAYDFEFSDINRITFNGYRDWAPKLNHDLGRIAFVSDSLVKPYLFTMTKEGNDVRKITNIGVAGYHNEGNAFAWDEDGGKIVFSHYQHLYEVNSDGTGLQSIATAPADRHFREVDISPDNSKIVVLTIGEKIYNSEIYLMDRDGSNQEVLIDSLEGIVAAPTFSIDGNFILYTHDVSENEALDGRMLNSQIFRLNLDTREITGLSENKPNGTNDLTPRYSPTGSKIIFTNVVNNNSRPKEIWMMDVDGENREQLVIGGELPNWN